MLLDSSKSRRWTDHPAPKFASEPHLRDTLLVAIMNNRRDFAIARTQGWYRIPVRSAHTWVRDHWPPRWVAFYQTKAFGDEAHAVRYFARVLDIQEAFRWQLFPKEAPNEKSERKYYQVFLGPLQTLPRPIVSRRWRRITFIPTTWEKFISAKEVNDLYDGSRLEDRLWQALKQNQIPAERQEFVWVKDICYALDFAIYCAHGKIDVEADGDRWHANPRRASADNRRDNALTCTGWKVLRFGERQVAEEASDYCIPTIADTIYRLGGVREENQRDLFGG